jgi:hypothetical protein
VRQHDELCRLPRVLHLGVSKQRMYK